MTLWKGNGAVLKSSSPWQLKELELLRLELLRTAPLPIIKS